MSKPESFILNTDYATLANDAGPASVSATMPSGIIIAPNAVYSTFAEVAVGQRNASIRSTISTTKEGNRRYTTMNASVVRTGFIDGNIQVPYTLLCYLTRVDPTTMRLTVAVWNQNASNLITEFGDETFTARIVTFISPFQQNDQ